VSQADILNQSLARTAPEWLRSLSPLGLASAYPLGIPAQAAEAKTVDVQATAGEVTDGRGAPLPLPAIAHAVIGEDPADIFRYSPMGGVGALRDAWRGFQKRLGSVPLITTRPVVTHGLTHGLSLVADLFATPETTIVTPDRYWGNYRLVFGGRSGARIATWNMFKDGGLDLGAFEAVLARPGRQIVVFNFPHNPTGYVPTPAELGQLCELLAARSEPTVIVADDAYAGVVFDDDRIVESPFWRMAEATAGKHIVAKVDGATKELLFFGSRVGFLTFAAPEAAHAAIESKITALIRGSVGSAAAPSQALSLRAIRDPGTPDAIASLLQDLRPRYDALKAAIAEHSVSPMIPLPFFGAYFALIRIPGVDAEIVRKRMLSRGYGVIALGDAVRVTWSSIRASDIDPLIRALAEEIQAVNA